MRKSAKWTDSPGLLLQNRHYTHNPGSECNRVFVNYTA
jgi:hypothetical protein